MRRRSMPADHNAGGVAHDPMREQRRHARRDVFVSVSIALAIATIFSAYVLTLYLFRGDEPFTRLESSLATVILVYFSTAILAGVLVGLLLTRSGWPFWCSCGRSCRRRNTCRDDQNRRQGIHGVEWRRPSRYLGLWAASWRPSGAGVSAHFSRCILTGRLPA
jgi:hypothetical protein